MPSKVKRNFENYATKREAFIAYEELAKNHKTPIWLHGGQQPNPLGLGL